MELVIDPEIPLLLLYVTDEASKPAGKVNMILPLVGIGLKFVNPNVNVPCYPALSFENTPVIDDKSFAIILSKLNDVS